MKKLIIILLCLALAGSSYAATIIVKTDGSGDYSTIQAAIDDSNDGDVIIVQPGLYDENINFLGKNITVTSTNPVNPNVVAETIIGNNYPNEAVIIFRGDEDLNCTLTGFNINGYIEGFDSSCLPRRYKSYAC